MLSRLAGFIERGLEGVLLIAMAVMVVSICYQVFGRYVLNSAPGWTEETARFLMAWITMLASARVLRSQEHIAVNVLAGALPSPYREVLGWLRDTVILVMAGSLVWYGYAFAEIGGRRDSAALEISMYWPHLAIPVGGAFMALLLVLQRFSQLAGEEQ